MRYAIKNWAEFQHYKDRNPPWIKLHFALLSSADWVALDDASRTLAIACMLLASRSDGQIDGSKAGLAYIHRVAYLNSQPNLKPLIECGFLVPLSDASAMQADARPETETETDTDTPTQESVGAHLIPLDWMPEMPVTQIAKDYHVTTEQVHEVVKEFREYWSAAKAKRKNWNLVWVKNPVAKGRFHSLRKKNNGAAAPTWEGID